jgi:hypothetical protein
VVSIIALNHPRDHAAKAGSSSPTSGGLTSGLVSSPARSSSPAATSSSRPAPTHSSSASSSAGPSSSHSSGAAPKLPLVVLNNTTIQGLAAQASDTFEAGGWTVTEHANYQNDILSTCAYYDPNNPQAEASAERLRAQFPAIKRVEPQFSGLGQYDSPIVVILTPDYTD